MLRGRPTRPVFTPPAPGNSPRQTRPRVYCNTEPAQSPLFGAPAANMLDRFPDAPTGDADHQLRRVRSYVLIGQVKVSDIQKWFRKGGSSRRIHSARENRLLSYFLLWGIAQSRVGMADAPRADEPRLDRKCGVHGKSEQGVE